MDAQQATRIAETTLGQFGGRRALAMIGGSTSRELSGALQIRFRARNPEGWGAVKITLDPDDTYTMEFFRVVIQKGYTSVKKKSVSGVYCDGLQSAFEITTKLCLSI